MMSPSSTIAVAPDLVAIVAPQYCESGPVTVRHPAPDLDEPLRLFAEELRRKPRREDVVTAVRAMYRRTGVDPTKTRPSSEALARRVGRGAPLPRVNNLVDVINWSSAESALPFGLYDVNAIQGAVWLRFGTPGEQYAGIRKDVVHVAGRLTLADEIGPFGNPTSDSARTMVTTATTSALVVIFAPTGAGADIAAEARRRTEERIARYCR